MKVLVTGANGFVGGALVVRLMQAGHKTIAAVRSNPEPDQTVVGEISAQTDWSQALSGCDVVVHTAARVHHLRENAADPLAEFRRVNTAGTLNLACQSVAAGVKRLVFISTIKVHGDVGVEGCSFEADDMPAPKDPYGVSKHEAEQFLRQVASETGLEVVIIRPPLVYGPRVKGNFASMMSWIARGVPLPLGAVTNNRRSLVALDNLIDLIVTCLNHPAAANQTFLVSDGESVSTTDLLRRLGSAIGKPARLIPVPPLLLRAAAMLLRKGDMVQRLLGNLQLDMSYTCQTLDWKPPISLDEGLHRAVKCLHK